MREIEGLTYRVCNIHIVTRNDKWVCNISSDGIFHVNVLRTQIDWRNMMPGEISTNWIHDISLKINCFMWRAKLDRIPTACALMKRGIQITSDICTYCESDMEDTTHVLFRCPVASKVWEWIFLWCKIPHIHFGNVAELVKFVAQWGTCLKKMTLTSICYGTTWIIWKARCDRIFKKNKDFAL